MKYSRIDEKISICTFCKIFVINKKITHVTHTQVNY